MKKNFTKRIFALTLSVMLAVTMVPITAFAAELNPPTIGRYPAVEGSVVYGTADSGGYVDVYRLVYGQEGEYSCYGTTQVSVDRNWSVRDFNIDILPGDTLYAVFRASIDSIEQSEPSAIITVLPKAPAINTIYSVDTSITGNILGIHPEGSTVVASWGNVNSSAGTINSDGSYRIPVSSLEAGQTVTVTVTVNGQPNSSTMPVQASPMEKSAAPSVNEIFEGDKSLGGQGIAGSTITVASDKGFESSNEVDSAGKWVIGHDSAVCEGEVFSITQTEPGKSESDPVRVTAEASVSLSVQPSGYIVVDDISEEASVVTLDSAIRGGHGPYEITITTPGGETIKSDALNQEVSEAGKYKIVATDQDGRTAEATCEVQLISDVLSFVDWSISDGPYFTNTTIDYSVQYSYSGRTTSTHGLEVRVDDESTFDLSSVEGTHWITPDSHSFSEPGNHTFSLVVVSGEIVQTLWQEEVTVYSPASELSVSVDPVYEGDDVISGTGEAGKSFTLEQNGTKTELTVDEDGAWSTPALSLAAGDPIVITEAVGISQASTLIVVLETLAVTAGVSDYLITDDSGKGTSSVSFVPQASGGKGPYAYLVKQPGKESYETILSHSTNVPGSYGLSVGDGNNREAAGTFNVQGIEEVLSVEFGSGSVVNLNESSSFETRLKISGPIATNHTVDLRINGETVASTTEAVAWTESVVVFSKTFDTPANYTLSAVVTDGEYEQTIAQKTLTVAEVPPVYNTYKFSQGFDTYTGNEDALTAIIEADADNFVALYIDGKELVYGEDYKVEVGSTVLTLSKAYLDTLENGEYPVVAYYLDGEATTMLTVDKSIGKKALEATPLDTGKKKTKLAKVGDTSSDVCALLTLSMLGLFIFLAAIRFKKMTKTVRR